MKNEKIIKHDLKKIQQSRQFLVIMILLFVVLIFWVIVSLISSQISEKIDPELLKISQPLTPVIETKVFAEIANKREYSVAELSSFTIYKLLTSRDGRTERIVPIEVNIDDLEPRETPNPIQTSSPSESLLQEELNTQENVEGENIDQSDTEFSGETP
jgi:hypothetical protein